MAAPATVDEYIAGFPPHVAERLQRIREIIVAEVMRAPASRESGVEPQKVSAPLSGESGAEPQHAQPEEKMRYGIAAVMLGGRYALHFAGWKKHIGLYPVPTLDEPLESEIAPYRAEKDSVGFPHSKPIPYDLIRSVTRAIVARRAAAQSEND
jgi:uncharacterized protein YdhG (YjbR/CyaY superfamily)